MADIDPTNNEAGPPEAEVELTDVKVQEEALPEDESKGLLAAVTKAPQPKVKVDHTIDMPSAKTSVTGSKKITSSMIGMSNSVAGCCASAPADPTHSYWIGPKKPFPEGGIPHMVIAAARKNWRKPAIRGPRSPEGHYNEIHYADLIGGAQVIAKHLATLTSRNQFVGVLLDRDIEFIVAALGVMFAGAAYLPCAEKVPEERLAYILEDSEVSVIITSRELYKKKNLDIHFTGADKVVIYYEDLEFDDFETAVNKPFPDIDCPVQAGDLAYSIYTSGTTGKPKGVEIEHRGVVNMLHHHANVLVNKEDCRKSVIVASLIFDSSIRETWLPLTVGGCLCIAPDVLNLTEGTMCAGTPSGLTVAEIPPTIRTVMVGGERLAWNCVKHIQGMPLTEKGEDDPNEVIKDAVTIVNAYGPTECTVECMVHDTDMRKKKEVDLIGRPIWNVDLYGIPRGADRENLTLAKFGEDCELYVGGVGVARGYHGARMAQKNLESFMPNPFSSDSEDRIYKTGDLVVFTSEGVRCKGRADNQIKLRGLRIELDEVERVCTAAPGVDQCVVVVCEDPKKSQHLVVWIKPANADPIPYATAQMPKYMVPTLVMGIDEFPLAVGGKVDRKILPTMYPPDWDGNLKKNKLAEAEVAAEAASKKKNLRRLTTNIVIPDEAALAKFEEKLSNLAEGEEEGEDDIGMPANVKAVCDQIIETVKKVRGDPGANIGPDQNLFSEIGMTSLDAALLRSELLEAGVSINGTATILKLGTPRKIAEHLINDTGAEEEEWDADTLQGEDPMDNELPRWAVWIISLGFFLLAILLNYCSAAVVSTLAFICVYNYGYCYNQHITGYEGSTALHSIYPICDEGASDIRGWWFTVVGLPIILIGIFFMELLIIVLAKWIVIGKYRPGTYSIRGFYYHRWLFVHSLMTFAQFFLLGPLRCTGLLKLFYRALGAKIGKCVVLDTNAVFEADLLDIHDYVTIQSDALVKGHTLTSRDQSNRNVAKNDPGVLILGRITIKSDSIIGPYASVGPAGPTLVREEHTVIDGIIPALMSNTQKEGIDPQTARKMTVWTPPVPTWMQFLGFFVVVVLHWAALLPALYGFFHFFVFDGAACVTAWWSECIVQNYGFAVFQFLWMWTMGLPYMFLVICYKWIVIGKFRAGHTTPHLDNRRWLLQTLLQSRLLVSTIGVSMSSPILTNFYRALGMKIGWNAQMIPIMMTEFDLMTIGKSTSFGGQVSIFCRDHTGAMRGCSLGDDAAITNSAIMLAGSSIGERSLVGNLTLLPPDKEIPADTKCMGNPCMTFPGGGDLPKVQKCKSDWIMFLHLVASLFVELVDQPAWIIVNFGLSAIYGNWWVDFGLGGIALAVVFIMYALVVLVVLTVIIFKHMFTKFVNDHERDSWVFVQFMYMTKVIVSTDHHIFRMLNGTPWMPLMYKMMGNTNIDTSAVMMQRHATDFDALTIKKNVVLGFDTYLELHQKAGGMLSFQEIVISANAALGARGILLRGSAVSEKARIHGLSMVLPGEPVQSGSVWGGRPARSYYVPLDIVPLFRTLDCLNARTLANINVGANTAAAKEKRYQQQKKQTEINNKQQNKRKQLMREETTSGVKIDFQMLVVGAGNSGLLAAFEYKKAGLSFLVLEKSMKTMGCWNPECGANKTSHVAVTEPAYRFPMDYDMQFNMPEDYTPSTDLLKWGELFVKAHKLREHISFNSEVVEIKEINDQDASVVRVTYKKGDETTTVHCNAIYIAIGAQQRPRYMTWKGEETFTGTLAYGIRNDIEPESFAGKRVVIIGNGAFSVENARTALMHKAEHVTIVYRRAFQCWPRVLHYLSSLGGKKLAEQEKIYNSIQEWSGIGALGDASMDEFMSLNTYSQPTASDFVFAAHRAGILTIVKDEISHLDGGDAVCKHSGNRIPCDMFLKCVGWHLPDLRKIFPGFENRQFIFCNKKPSIVFVCDPHYQVDSHDYNGPLTPEVRAKNEQKRQLMMQAEPEGGTFSVLVLARCAALLQLYMLTKPAAFAAALKTIPSSTSPMCSWFEQRWQYDGLTELNALITTVLRSGKKKLLESYDLAGFIKMANSKLMRDMRATSRPDAIVHYPFKVAYDEDGREMVVMNDAGADSESYDSVAELPTNRKFTQGPGMRKRHSRGLSSHSVKFASSRHLLK